MIETFPLSMTELSKFSPISKITLIRWLLWCLKETEAEMTTTAKEVREAGSGDCDSTLYSIEHMVDRGELTKESQAGPHLCFLVSGPLLLHFPAR